MHSKETVRLLFSPLMLQFTFCYCLLKSRPDNYYSMTSTFLTFPFILLSVLLSAPSNAQTEPDENERWFQTEIIVFEIREKNTIDSQEIWPDDPGLPNYENSIELSPIVEIDFEVDVNNAFTPVKTIDLAATSELIESTSTEPAIAIQRPQEQPFQLLSETALTLTKFTETLTNSTKYIPILNIAWRQPVASKTAAQTIYIHSNLGQVTLTSAPDLTNLNTLMAPTGLNETPMLFAPQSGNEKNPIKVQFKALDGTIKLHLGRYLHLEADLLYRSQTEPPENNPFFISFDDIEQPQTLFRLHQKRRLRSGELHYFDHPMFGMLVKIIPYERPEPETELEANLESDAASLDDSVETIDTEVR